MSAVLERPTPAAPGAPTAGGRPAGGSHDDRRRRDVVIVAVGLIALVASLVWMWASLRPTNASFSDAETVANNRLGAGTLDIEVGARTAAFRAENLAAGDRVSGLLELRNAGTLPLRYRLSSYAPESPLRDVLEVVAWIPSSAAGPCPVTPPSTGVWNVLDSAEAGRPDAPVTNVDGGDDAAVRNGALATAATALVCLSASLPITAGSEVAGARLDLIIGIDAVHDVAASTGGES